jgi:hypothetical protein
VATSVLIPVTVHLFLKMMNTFFSLHVMNTMNGGVRSDGALMFRREWEQQGSSSSRLAALQKNKRRFPILC